MLRNLEAGKKNAKLAGVDKLVGFSKVETDWLDTKLDARKIDLVISKIPCPSNHYPESDARKIYKELFYQSEFFMKKKGRMVLMAENLTLFKEMVTKDFKIIGEDQLYSGKQALDVVIIEKN